VSVLPVLGPTVGFLGHVISQSSSSRIAELQWIRKRSQLLPSGHSRPPAPTSADSSGWARLANYYSKFATFLASPRRSRQSAGFSPHARFSWGQAEQQHFDALSAALTSALVLHVWDQARPTCLLTDALELAVSAILKQPDDAGAFRPVAFESSKLMQPER
jgi:hypothetical protein